MPYKDVRDKRAYDRRYWLKVKKAGPSPVSAQLNLAVGVTRDLGIKAPKGGLRIAVIPDVQAMEGVPLDHLTWCGKYLAVKQPDVVVCIGDFGDFPSLSRFERGTRAFEGRRYKKDIAAFHRAMELLMNPIARAGKWRPYLEFTEGNHEDHLDRATQEDPKLEGLISKDDLRLKDYGWRQHAFLQPIAIGGVAFCLAPEHRVLTADLRYVPLRELKPGDTLLAFDENGPYRKYVSSSVLRIDPAMAQVYAVKLKSGKEFVTTADHRWLTLSGSFQQWAATDKLRAGTPIPRFFDEWTHDLSHDAGWLAGFIDGEGWLSKPNTKQGGLQVGVAQNEGPTLEKVLSLLRRRGVRLTKHNKTGGTCRAVRVGGPSPNKLKFLGEIRPERLISKFKPEMLGRIQAIAVDEVVSVTDAGMRPIVMIETSSRTMISEGYGHHNCHYFPSGVMGKPISSAPALLRKLHMSAFAGHQQGREIAYSRRADGSHMTAIISGSFYQHEYSYLSPFTNAHWRGMFFLHQVQDGRLDEMAVSIEFLKRKFGGK